MTTERPLVFRLHTPPAPLDRYVENFWLYRGYSAPHLRERIVQDGTFKLVFNLAQNEFRIYDPWRPRVYARYSGAIVSRPSAVPFVTDSAEESYVLGVNFRIGGALPLIGHAASRAEGSHVELRELWGRNAQGLHEQLAHETEWSKQFRILEGALLRQLSTGERHHSATRTAFDLLGAAGPTSRTREVAKHVGLSQRRFITIFEQEIGVTPKLFSRVRRFQRVLRSIRRSAAPDWAEIAGDAGYYDQSHMIRDFVAFSGFSPAEYSKHCRLLAERGVRVKHNHIPLFE